MAATAKRSLICLALVVAMSLGLTAAAGAKQRSHRSTSHASSTIALQSVGPDGVNGEVSSPSNACRTQRQVTLYRVNSGPGVPSGEFVASTWTRGDGSWSVTGPLYPSEFYAVLGSKSTKGAVCGSATSNSLQWG